LASAVGAPWLSIVELDWQPRRPSGSFAEFWRVSSRLAASAEFLRWAAISSAVLRGGGTAARAASSAARFLLLG